MASNTPQALHRSENTGLAEEMARKINDVCDQLSALIEEHRRELLEDLTHLGMQQGYTKNRLHTNDQGGTADDWNKWLDQQGSLSVEEAGSRPAIEYVLEQIKMKLSWCRPKNARSEEGGFAVKESALRLLADIGRDMTMFQRGAPEIPKHSKELAILGVLAEAVDTERGVTLDELAQKTGYESYGIAKKIRYMNDFHLNTTNWRIIGKPQTGWKLLRMSQNS